MSDRLASKQFREWFGDRTVENEFVAIKTYLRPGASVLDVGCGPGTITIDVARLVVPGQVVGVDWADASIQRARKTAGEAGIANVSFQAADAMGLPFGKASYDVAYSNMLLMWLPDPAGALAEQKRVVKCGGWVIAQGDDRVATVMYPPCPGVEMAFRAAAEAFDPSMAPSVYDGACGRKLYGLFMDCGFESVQVAPTNTDRGWARAGDARIEKLPFPQITDPSVMRDSLWFKTLRDSGVIDENWPEVVAKEVILWRSDPHAFYFCPNFFVAGRVP